MITGLTNDKYKKLFRDASEILTNASETEIEITSLNEYFQNLPTLIGITIDGQSILDTHPEFVILPADEEFFEINANTREITIPKSFKKMASVAGDQAAETVFFKIDRYFDTMDLNNQEIYIEWKAPNQSGLSKEFIRDVTSEPGYIIFGWALQEEITEYAGTIEFAVRFYTYNADNQYAPVQYSFSTLPAKIVIGKSIDTDYDMIDDSVSAQALKSRDLILKRIVPSRADSANTNIALPEILDDIKDYRIILENDEPYIGYVQGYTSDYGTLNYYLLSGKDRTKLDMVYVETEDEAVEPKNTYYQEVNNEYKIFEGSAFPTDGTIIYEKMAEYSVDTIGAYKIEIENRVGANLKSIYTDEFIVPAPQVPVVTGNLERSLYYENDALTINFEDASISDEGSLSYQWSYGNNGEDYIINDNVVTKEYVITDTDPKYEYYKVIAVNNLNNASEESEPVVYRVTDEPTVKLITSDNDNTVYNGTEIVVTVEYNQTDMLKYEWLIGNNIDESGAVDGNEIRYTPIDLPNTTVITLKVTNELNGRSDTKQKMFIVAENNE